MSSKAEIGTIIHGTLTAQDLINAFIDEIRRIRGNLPRPLFNQLLEFGGQAASPQEEIDRQIAFLGNLEDELSFLVPPFCYFGTHPGDGSDFGFWPCDIEDIMCEPGVRVVEDLSEVPDKYRGFVLLINDHGNVTLYKRTATNKDREVWSIV